MWLDAERYIPELESTNRVSLIFALFAVFGVATIAIWAFATGDTVSVGFTIAGVTIVVAGAAAMLGGLLGFLFGIPRTMQDGAEAAAGSGETRQLVNTNLERVSDWLTTMLIGATLIQITSLPNAIWTSSATIVSVTAVKAAGFQSMVAGVFVYFLIVGFFSGYLLTRLYLTLAFGAVQQQLSKRDKDIVLARAAQPEVEPTKEQRASAQEITKKPLASLTLAEDVQAWAQAQKILKAFDKAADGFQKLMQMNPGDPQAKLSYASMLDQLGQTRRADEVRAQVARQAQEQTAKLNVNTMLSLLYRPGRYEDVIVIGEDNIANGTNTSGELYFLLSVAYAQKYASLKATTADETTEGKVAEARSKVLANLQTAISKDPAYKERAKMLWDPAYPNKNKGENDFEIFKAENDAQFEQLLK